MRVSQPQIKGLIKACTDFFPNSDWELYLFGSRAHDLLKGGDIDLLIITEDRENQIQADEKKNLLLASMKRNIGDQKIDLIVASIKKIKEDHFL